MHDHDLVFTSPIDTILDSKVITSRIDKSKGTMSILYGNEMAVAAARKGKSYLAGSVLTLVTWKQKEDEHWYGGNVPDSLLSVEKFTFGADTARRDWITQKASVMP